MKADIFNQLNSKQKEAIEKITGPSIILAGAGSGKTRVLVNKVINLIENHHISPSSIIMITFTNKAAAEMKTRIKNYRLGFIGTFHSFCVRILRIEGEAAGLKNNFLIYDDNDQISLIKLVIKKLNIGKRYTPAYFLNRISGAKNMLIGPLRYMELFSDSISREIDLVYNEYQRELKKNGAVDFDDLIMTTVGLLTKNKNILSKYQDRYRFILVDEFQDTNYAQYVLTRMLGKKYQNVTIVGDFSQSIYSWRGAEIKNLEKFKTDFSGVKTFYLEENYRSTQTILDFAYGVISKNSTHPILNLFTKKKGGEEIGFFEADNEEEEAVYLATIINNLKTTYKNREMAILYRTNAQSRVIEEAFLHYGIPYVLIGGTRFYERKEIKDVLSYLRLLINPVDKISVERITKLGKRRWEDFKKFYDENKDSAENIQTDQLIEKIFQATKYLELYDDKDEDDFSRLENIKELKSVAVAFPSLTEFLEQVALVESEYFEGEKTLKYNKLTSGQEADDRVRLMTLHQAKGLEFPVVFIAGVEEGILPHSRSVDDENSLEEERRLFYVGVTRAKKKLHITYAKRRFIFGRRNEAVKSRFLEDVI